MSAHTASTGSSHNEPVQIFPTKELIEKKKMKFYPLYKSQWDRYWKTRIVNPETNRIYGINFFGAFLKIISNTAGYVIKDPTYIGILPDPMTEYEPKIGKWHIYPTGNTDDGKTPTSLLKMFQTVQMSRIRYEKIVKHSDYKGGSITYRFGKEGDLNYVIEVVEYTDHVRIYQDRPLIVRITTSDKRRLDIIIMVSLFCCNGQLAIYSRNDNGALIFTLDAILEMIKEHSEKYTLDQIYTQQKEFKEGLVAHFKELMDAKENNPFDGVSDITGYRYQRLMILDIVPGNTKTEDIINQELENAVTEKVNEQNFKTAGTQAKIINTISLANNKKLGLEKMADGNFTVTTETVGNEGEIHYKAKQNKNPDIETKFTKIAESTQKATVVSLNLGNDDTGKNSGLQTVFDVNAVLNNLLNVSQKVPDTSDKGSDDSKSKTNKKR